MSKLTDYTENHLLDWLLRGQTWTLPGSLYVGLASAASDSAITELSGTGYARQAATRALATWAGTQGAGTTLASSGTGHATSNNAAISFGTAGSAWGTANYVVLCDASTAGNVLAYLPISAVTISSGNPVSIATGAVSMTLGLSGGCSDYLCNNLIDYILRGQSFTPPASTYVALYTAAPSNAGGGTEVSGGSYARIAIASSLTAWAGTQSAGSTTASTGTSGVTSNNAAVTFAAPTADWGALTHLGLHDAPSGGNLLTWGALGSPQTISAGGVAPAFDPGALTVTAA